MRAAPEEPKAPEPATPIDAPASEPPVSEPVAVIAAEPVPEIETEATATDEVSPDSAHLNVSATS